jgi:catechol 2,3-dioxygenase-like lactoylglutathione lyase family enzyme
MVRITDPEQSRAFYEALGFRFGREMDIVRNGEREATNYRIEPERPPYQVPEGGSWLCFVRDPDGCLKDTSARRC